LRQRALSFAVILRMRAISSVCPSVPTPTLACAHTATDRVVRAELPRAVRRPKRTILDKVNRGGAV
jgi:hypothetical protein